MLYDNDKYTSQGITTYIAMQKINEEIVKDIDVIRCTYNYTTKFTSIDDRDMLRLVSFPGRIFIARLEDFKEKDCDNTTIEDMLVDTIKRNGHVENQRDKKVMAGGVISNLSPALQEDFDNEVPNVRKFVGEPIHNFSHIYVNDDRKKPNNVFLILSGLSPVNDKINKISDRIDEIKRAQEEIYDDGDALKGIGLDGLSDEVSDKEKEKNDTVDIKAIFDNFGV